MLDAEQQVIQDRAKRYAQQAYEAPQGRMIGRQYVAPNILQHIAAGLRGYGSIQGMNQSEQDLKDLQAKRQETETRDMGAFVNALRGTPARDAVTLPDDQAGPVMPAQAAVAGNPMDAYSLAAASQSPTVRSMGMTGLAKMPELEAQKQERIDNRAFRAQESELARQARAQELQQRSEDQRNSQAERLAAQKELRQMQIDNQLQMQKMIQDNRPEKNVTVLGPNGEALTMPQSQAQGMPLYNPNAAKELQKNKTKGEAKEQLSGVVQQLNNSYDALDKGGGITSTSNRFGSNLGAGIGSSGVGQYIGGKLGTENQRHRQEIEQTRPLLLNLIKDATGMSSQQMNSNAEMNLYLKAATDPTLTLEANRSALANLDKMFGLGLAKRPDEKKAGGNIDSLLDKYK